MVPGFKHTGGRYVNSDVGDFRWDEKCPRLNVVSTSKGDELVKSVSGPLVEWGRMVSIVDVRGDSPDSCPDVPGRA